MQIAFYTLGCKVNQYESKALAEDFSAIGFNIVSPDEVADVYVLNSCTVTSSSDKKTRQILRRFRRQNKDAIVALLGCFPQAFPEESLALVEADIILGASNKSQLVDAVTRKISGFPDRIVNIQEYTKDEKFESASIKSFGEKTRAFVKIQDGCNRYCTYCIIPYARGPVRSKPIADLKLELENLAESGYKEVVLVGINLSCYGVDIDSSLLEAIQLAASISGIHRVRLGSLEPELLSPETIAEMGSIEKLCPQFHLSLQSGSDSTLKRMGRHYNTKDYQTIVDNLKSAFPNTAITTDLMVGFPGETQQEFDESVAFAKQIGFARTHVFAYCRRAGTRADKMEDQLTQSVKNQRSREMSKVTLQLQEDFLKTQVGLTLPVLFEVENDNVWEGYSPNYSHVLVKTNENLENTIRNVKIISIDSNSCIGELVD